MRVSFKILSHTLRIASEKFATIPHTTTHLIHLFVEPIPGLGTKNDLLSKTRICLDIFYPIQI